MKTYLGNGVYFEFRDYELILTTKNGIRIVMSPDEIINLIRALDKIVGQFQSLKERQQ